MSLFQYSDYREYLRGHVKQLAKPRGEFTKMAKHLRVNTTLLSQVLAGGRNFSEEQTFELSGYLGHTPMETDYFSLLVQIERAGSTNLRHHLEKKLKNLRTEATRLTHRIRHERTLTEEERSVFYSSWVFSAVHLFTSTKPKGVSIEEVVSRFDLTRAKASEIVQFLLQAGLVVEKNDHYQMGVQSTFVGHDSPHLGKHYANWRLKAIQKSETLTDRDLMYSGQFSLSKKDFEALRETIAEFLKSANKIVADSPAEDIAALNIDWFWID